MAGLLSELEVVCWLSEIKKTLARGFVHHRRKLSRPLPLFQGSDWSFLTVRAHRLVPPYMYCTPY